MSSTKKKIPQETCAKVSYIDLIKLYHGDMSPIYIRFHYKSSLML